MSNLIEKNIPKIYALSFSQALMLVVPLFVPLASQHQLSLKQIFLTQSAFALTVVICELPAGLFADRYSKKVALILGSSFCFAAYFVLLSASEFNHFIVFEVLMGLGLSFSSGADYALLYETRTAINKNESGKEVNAGQLLLLGGLAEGLAGAIAFGALFYSMKLALILQLMIGLIPLSIALSLREIPKPCVATQSPKLHETAKVVVSNPLMLATFFLLIAFGLMGLLAFWLQQALWIERQIEPQYFGLLWAGFCLARALGALLANRLEAKWGPSKVIALTLCLPLGALLAIGTISSQLIILLGATFPLARGILFALFYDAMNRRLSNTQRATVHSLSSLATRIGFIALAPILGGLSDTNGAASTMLILATGSAPLIVILVSVLARAISQSERKQSA